MFSVIALFLAPLGPVVVAGHQVALNVVSLLFMLPLSIGMALTLRVSFLLGAGAPDTARLISRSSLILAATTALVFAILLFAFSQGISALYTSDADVQAVTTRLLMFAAIFQVADVIQVTCISALRLQGHGHTHVDHAVLILGCGVAAGLCPNVYRLDYSRYGRGRLLGGADRGLASASVLLGWRLFRYRPKPSGQLAG